MPTIAQPDITKDIERLLAQLPRPATSFVVKSLYIPPWGVDIENAHRLAGQLPHDGRGKLWLRADQDMDHVRVGGVGVGLRNYYSGDTFLIKRRNQSLSGLRKLGVFVCVYVDCYETGTANAGFDHALVTPINFYPTSHVECSFK